MTAPPAGGAGERVFQQVVQGVAAAGGAEHPAQALEGRHGEPRAARHDHLVAGQVAGHGPGPVGVHREPLVVPPVALGHDRIGDPVHVVGGGIEAGQAAGEERLPDPLRGERQVGGRAEAAEALAQHAPRLVAGQPPPDQLRIPDDRVGPEVAQVVRLGPGAAQPAQRVPGRRGGPAGAALVEEQHPVVVQGPVQPGLPAERARAAEPGAALEENQPRQGRIAIAPARGRDLAGEHLDLLAIRPVVVERHGERVVGEHRAWLAEHRAGPCICSHGSLTYATVPRWP